jgi:putative membrane-bound dehydrogenase-like protein
MPPEEAARTFKMPEGFRVSVFAGEPDVRQPIAMATDPRGRLWVAENYTYAESKRGYETRYNDRILIFEDVNGDGRFDKRTVFWDQGKILTSVEVGLGGVFALCPPQLLFIPDRDGDGVPDGPPEVLLDGFNNVNSGRHTFPNGLKWGPDGWLWGRIGISTGARVGRPGTPDADRVEMRGGIWRYHPGRHAFEGVSHGTTNPWGLDWDEMGEPFFINTVIGHLWHAIPGAHFKRMHGDDVNPHSYVLIDQHADHYHFDTGAGWTHSRTDTNGVFAPGSDSLGGGHAHTGLMIYQGDNWPERYRGRLFTLNLHGRRVNEDRLERSGSGYIGRHEPDFLTVGDTWFRGLDLLSGPDGGVFISDWSDTGECHDDDGVHRTSGRIYKITYGEPRQPKVADLTKASNEDLVSLVFDHNEWFSRQARRVLADRAALGADLSAPGEALKRQYGKQATAARKLRALWALNIIGKAPPSWLLDQTKASDEHVRSWAVRLLTDWTVEVASQGSSSGLGDADLVARVFTRFISMGRNDPSALVRLYLASSLQRLPPEPASRLAMELVRHSEDAADHNLGPMLWYGIEPLVVSRPDACIDLAKASQHRLVRRLIARRMSEGIETAPGPLSQLLARLSAGRSADLTDILGGMSDALRGRRKAPPPPGWAHFAELAAASADSEARNLVRELGALFGDGRALDDLRKVAADPKENVDARRNALKTLVTSRAENLAPLLKKLADDGPIRANALAGLLELGEPGAPALAVNRYSNIGHDERPVLLAAIVARPESARLLLDAIARGKISRSDVTPFHARQIAGLNDPALAAQLAEVWGSVRPTDSQKQAQIQRIRQLFPPGQLKLADASHGRELFDRICASCHQLYGAGGRVGPDLTGSGRRDLDYLLGNVIDPSAVVPLEYRMSVLTLKDGRVLNGIVRNANDRTLTLQSPAEASVVEKQDIASIDQSSQSMMPDGLLDALKESEIRDLLGYLTGSQQVPPPAPASVPK